MQATGNILSEAEHSPAAIIPRTRLAGGVVWDAASLKPTDGIVTLEADAGATESDLTAWRAAS